MFSQLHTHTHIGSRLDAMASPGDYAERAAEFNHKAVAITDHGRLNGIHEHQQQCLKYDVKPIIGVEMYVADELEVYGDDEKRKRTKNRHVVLLVKNKKGYENLLRLNYISVKDTEHFYYLPRINKEELFRYNEGLVLGTACMGNPFAQLMLMDRTDDAYSLFEEYHEVFKEDFYVEIQLNELQDQKRVNELMINLANVNGVPIVMTGDVHYLEKGQHELQTLAMAIRDKSTIDNIQFEFESKELYYHHTNDYIDFNERFNYNYDKSDIISWCRNTTDVSVKIDFLLPERNKLFLPKITDDDDRELIKKGKAGLEERFECDYKDVPKEYRSQLEKELEVIIRKGFSSYFLIVDDITQFSIREGIYGRIGRGSVGGSLLAYSLGIHNLDPIKRGLLFERFMSDKRSPDLVLDYFCEK